jgi:hypothetical protein
VSGLIRDTADARSPALRPEARETVRLAGFLKPRTVIQLDELSSGNADAHSAWLRAKLAQRPELGTNVLIVTQMPNILESVNGAISAIAPGGALVFCPEGTGVVELLARIRIEHWSRLAQSARQHTHHLE